MCITVASYSKATAKVLIFSSTEAISHILLIYINNLSLSLCLSLPLCLSPFDFLSPVSHIVICRIAVWDRMQVAGASGMRIVVWDRMQVAGASGMRIAVWDRMSVAGVSGMRSLWYISWSPFPFSPYIARLPWRPDGGVGQYVRVKSMSWTASLAPAMRREVCACPPPVIPSGLSPLESARLLVCHSVSVRDWRMPRQTRHGPLQQRRPRRVMQLPSTVLRPWGG